MAVCGRGASTALSFVVVSESGECGEHGEGIVRSVVAFLSGCVECEGKCYSLMPTPTPTPMPTATATAGKG